MIPEPHVCMKCKKEIVWTDCLLAICYLCNQTERDKTNLPKPDAIVATPKERTEK